MSKPEKDLLVKALTNGTFDIDATDLALTETLNTSFSYLYRFQRNIIEYEEYCFTTRNNESYADYGDLYLDKYERVCFNCKTTLIDSRIKESYRSSSYFRTEIPIENLIGTKNLFSRVPVIMIDNKVLKTFSIVIHDDHFTVILPYKKSFLYTTEYDNNLVNLNNSTGSLKYIDHTINVQIVSNVSFVDIETNTAMLKLNSKDSKSLDRILMSYVDTLSSGFSARTDGRYFAVIFSDGYLGTALQDVELEADGNFLVNWDLNSINIMNSNKTNYTVRFIFFKNLYKHKAYSGKVKSRLYQNKVQSEIFMIQDTNGLYPMPIPIENLMICKIKKEDMIGSEHTTWSILSHDNATVKYPNIYTVNNGTDVGDELQVYYFFYPDINYHYDYQYKFFYRYLYFKWCEPLRKSIEEVVNTICFGDFDLTTNLSDTDLPINNVALIRKIDEMILNNDILEEDKTRFYNYMVKMQDNKLTRDFVSCVNLFNISKKEITDTTKPLRVIEFLEIFDYIMNKDIKDYAYDEADYLMNYKGNMTPFEYKITKMNQFISDDTEALKKYVLSQNKASIKYNFIASATSFAQKKVTVSKVNKNTFEEEMYLFTFDRKENVDDIACRIFIDGLLFTVFHYETYGFIDFIYIPVSAIPDGVFVEIEIFPTYYQKNVLNFKTLDDSVIVNFEAKDDIVPTLSDLYFHSTDNEFNQYSRSKFKMTLLSDTMNYDMSDVYETGYCLKVNHQYQSSLWYDPKTTKYYLLFSDNTIHVYEDGVDTGIINIADIPTGCTHVITKGSSLDVIDGYYTEDGNHYDVNGFYEESKSISKDALNTLITNGDVLEYSYKPSDNSFPITLDELYISRQMVYDGVSIINKKNTGLNHGRLVCVKFELLDASLLNTDIVLETSKTFSSDSQRMYQNDYPLVKFKVLNTYSPDEYIRVFKNGRLLSKNKYDYQINDGKPDIQILELLEKDDVLFVDGMPYRDRLVFYQHEITNYQINLESIINKPFDNRYYDIYLNGRRLSHMNIKNISDYEILLCDVHSIYNLEIYEKDRDWEYYSCDFSTYFTLSNLLMTSFMEKSVRDKLLKDLFGDLKPNDNTEPEEPWDKKLTRDTIGFEKFYYLRLIVLGFLNPEDVQFNLSDIESNFDLIYNLYHRKDGAGKDMLFLNPDLFFEGTTDEKWFVYPLGNNDASIKRIDAKTS